MPMWPPHRDAGVCSCAPSTGGGDSTRYYLMNSHGRFLASLAAAALVLLAQNLLAQPLPAGDLKALGFAPERLKRLEAGVRQYIADGKYAGASYLVARDGKIAAWETFGVRDIATGAPMEKDTIVRVYSMSKTVASVAVMMLFEEGRFRLDDPVSQYLPEFKQMKVFKGGTADQPELVDATRPITIRELLTHTSGFGYDFGESPLEQIYKRAKLWETPNLKEFTRKAAQLPLAHQPGEAWTYGIGIDVLGGLVEVVSGQRFEDFLTQRLFQPLGMKDTAFDVPPGKRNRLAALHETGPDGKLRLAQPLLAVTPEPGPKLAGGGGGLFSTIGDYARFAQMLLNGGELNGTRILGRKTVELMMVNHLNYLPRQTHIWSEADGFGLGGAVRIDLAKGGSLGSVGQFGWSGAATTYYNIDPHEGTVVLLFLQHFPIDQYGIFPKFNTLFYQSLVDHR